MPNTVELPPKTLFKYRSFDTQGHWRSIVHDTVFHFSCPLDFNDPFDTRVLPRILDGDAASRERLAAVIQKYFTKPLSDVEREVIVQTMIQMEKEHADLLGTITRKSLEQTFVRHAAVFSMCEIHDDLRMWAHYACSHEGFCLGFDAWGIGLLLPELWKSGYNIALKPVSYSRAMPVVDMMKIQTDIEVFDTFVLTKSIDWEYEKEWRLLGFGGPYDIEILPEILTTVYLGCRMKDTTKAELLEIIKPRRPHVRAYQARPKADEFKLVFDPLEL